jgi:hypothetical protein
MTLGHTYSRPTSRVAVWLNLERLPRNFGVVVSRWHWDGGADD